MPRSPKPTDHMDSVRHLMGTMPDHEVAKICNSTPSIVGRYRRRYGIPAYEGYKFGMGQEPPSKRGRDGEDEGEGEAVVAEVKPVEKKANGRSKLDAFRDVIGTLSDADVAARAGVTAEAVRIYRRRHGLNSRRENAAKAEAAAAAARLAESAAADAALADDKKSPQRRSSKLDGYMDLVGTLPDREVAAMAGVTPENVRAFRRRHDIPARWRAEGEEAPVEAAPVVEAPAVVVEPVADAPKKRGRKAAKGAPAAEAPAVEAPAKAPAVEAAPVVEAPKAAEVEAPEVPKAAPKATPKAAAKPTSGSMHGYAVHVRSGDTTYEYLIVASDIASAASNAMSAVGSRHADAEITSIRHLGPALV